MIPLFPFFEKTQFFKLFFENCVFIMVWKLFKNINFLETSIENIALGYASCDILFFEKHDILEPNIVQAIQDG